MRICVALPTKIILSATINLDPRYNHSVDCYTDTAHQNLGRREECKESARGFQILRWNNHYWCWNFSQKNSWMVETGQGTHWEANQTQGACRTQIGGIEKVSRNARSWSEISLRCASMIDFEDNVRASLIGRKRESIPLKSLGWVSKTSTLFVGIARCMSCFREISRCEQIVVKWSDFRCCESLVMKLDLSKKQLRGSATSTWNALQYSPWSSKSNDSLGNSYQIETSLHSRRSSSWRWKCSPWSYVR